MEIKKWSERTYLRANFQRLKPPRSNLHFRLPMFLLYLIALFFIARHLMAWKAPEIKELMSQVEMLKLDQQIPIRHRCENMGREFGEPWLAWKPESDESLDFVPPTVPINFVRRYFGPMDMEVAGDQVLIYDMLISLLHDPSDHGNHFQTVISLKPPELRLPPFTLRPNVGFGSLYSTSDSIETATSLDAIFDVESFAPHRVRALFQSELGTEVLIPFLTDRKWTIEWNRDRLIIYELNHVIAPQQLAEAALEASEFFECLKSGPDVVDRMMKQFIDSAVAKR